MLAAVDAGCRIDLVRVLALSRDRAGRARSLALLAALAQVLVDARGDQLVALPGRTTPLVVPKLIFGRPFWDAVKPFYRPWVPASVRNAVLRFLVWVVHGRMTGLGFGTHGAGMLPAEKAEWIRRRRLEGRRVLFAGDGLNDGPAAGQTVGHCHVHVIPRFEGDVADPRGGVRWVIPEKARYW